ncbi:MAG: SDR family NAD(P)-dependent oxidoreductase [Halioglobus sp.]|nr:SDR family NAD(P)-dependent oxidoreductase [Halioglobus sp.]
MDWKNKVAVITGASSGIGAGLALHCAQAGMHVVAAATNLNKLQELERQIHAIDGSVQIAQVDVADPAAVERLASEVFARFGAVHLLFNNAGILIDGKSWKRSYDEWDRSYRINVLGVVNGIRSFVPRMLAQVEPGRVINTASTGGLLSAVAYMGIYQSTKAAVVAISEALFQELAMESAPVSVSVLCPGEVVSDIYNRPREPGDHAKLSEDEMAVHGMVADMVARGMSASEYARRVLEGIEADKFWIITHDEFKPMLQLRPQSIVAGTNPPTLTEAMEHQG